MTDPVPKDPQGTATPASFRSDINALRAIAALAVVLFHFTVRGFDGGFAGVDIFFVISGLLMTQIIEKGLVSGRFSLLGFYGARVRRIVPAITACCLIVVGLGCLVLDPLVLGETAYNALSTMAFYSNIRYALQGSYFSDAAEANWFLHSWTLSVEWQFYLLYPVLLMLAARWRWLWQRRAPAALIACVLLFAATLVVSGYSSRFQELAFYLLPTRAWEMLAGGCVAFYRPHIASPRARAALGWGGLAVIVASILFISEAMPWPSAWMLLPVGGTVALLVAHRPDMLWTRIPGIQTTGLWSYSLYLWHWPVIAAMRYFDVAFSALHIVVGIAICFVLAGLSYTLVETRLRDRLFGTTRTAGPRRWLVAGGIWSVVALLIGTVGISNGLESWRTGTMPADTRAAITDYRTAISDWKAMYPCNPESFGIGKRCVIGAPGGEKVLLFGDSHVEQMIPRLQAIAPRLGLEITLIRMQGCPPLPALRWTRGGTQCGDFARKVFAYAAREPFKRMVVFAAWNVYFGRPAEGSFRPERFCAPSWWGCAPLHDDAAAWQMIAQGTREMGAAMADVRKAGIETVLVLPQPGPATGSPRRYIRDSFLSGRPAAVSPIAVAEFRSRTQQIDGLLRDAALQSGAKVIDPVDIQCPGGQCAAFYKGRYLFKDGHHLRASVTDAPAFRWLDDALTR